jgi:hypothetical protein
MIDLISALMTELIGWSIVSALILPGAVITVVLDQVTPLDRAQLWTLSLFFSGIVFVGLGYVLARGGHQDELLVWYAALVIVLAIVTGVLLFGFHARWVGAFLSRFRFGAELFNVDVWIPTVIRMAVASVIALTGTVTVLLARSASIVLNRAQVWMLALLLNAVLAYGLTRLGVRRHWFLFESDGDSTFETTVTAGGLLVVMANVVVMVAGCFLYYGVRVRALAGIFEQIAPAWPAWLNG